VPVCGLRRHRRQSDNLFHSNENVGRLSSIFGWYRATTCPKCNQPRLGFLCEPFLAANASDHNKHHGGRHNRSYIVHRHLPAQWFVMNIPSGITGRQTTRLSLPADQNPPAASRRPGPSRNKTPTLLCATARRATAHPNVGTLPSGRGRQIIAQ